MVLKSFRTAVIVRTVYIVFIELMFLQGPCAAWISFLCRRLAFLLEKMVCLGLDRYPFVAYCCILLVLFAQEVKVLPPFWLLKYVSDFTTLYWILIDHYFFFHTIFKGTKYSEITAIMQY